MVNFRPAADRDCSSQLDLLFHELLIGVTQFFRDRESWDALQQTVLPQLFEGKGATDTLRIWVPGYSTGEEVWSVAVLLREAMSRREINQQLCIFGTATAATCWMPVTATTRRCSSRSWQARWSA